MLNIPLTYIKLYLFNKKSTWYQYFKFKVVCNFSHLKILFTCAKRVHLENLIILTLSHNGEEAMVDLNPPTDCLCVQLKKCSKKTET